MVQAKDCPGSQGGGWTEETHTTLYPDTFNDGLAKYIATEIHPASVLEFGSGLGHLARYLNDHAATEPVHCIEPNLMQSVYDPRRGPILFALDIFRDPIPPALARTYDLVLSIEVAEHVPRDLHNQLFDFLYARAARWIIFSGGRIDQEGHGHIACRDEEDWRGEWTRRGAAFLPDHTAEARRSCNAKNINHARNVQVFKKS